MKIVFFGTSLFAAYVLQKLIEMGYSIVAVVTRPDRPKGRKLQLAASAVKQLVEQHYSHIPLYQPLKASDPSFLEKLAPYQPDLFVVLAYGEIIKQNLLDLPRKGCINIHASLLPHLRGAAPMQRSLMQGDHQTGITIIEMVAKMDAGDILAQQAIDIPENMTLAELESQLQPLAVELVAQVIEQIKQGTQNRAPQDESKVTFAPKLQAQEERIDWSADAQVIHNQIRGLSPHPGAWCEICIAGQVKRLKIKKSLVVEALESKAPGTFLSFDKSRWVVACGAQALQLLEVQLEGKKAMTAIDCLRGLPSDCSLS